MNTNKEIIPRHDDVRDCLTEDDYITEDVFIENLDANPYYLAYITNQTAEMCLTAVRKNGLTLEYVLNKTEEICLAAVKEDGLALFSITDQTEEVCLAAINQNPYSLRYALKQTASICLAALDKYFTFSDDDIDYHNENECVIDLIHKDVFDSEEFKRGLIDRGLFDLLE